MDNNSRYESSLKESKIIARKTQLSGTRSSSERREAQSVLPSNPITAIKPNAQDQQQQMRPLTPPREDSKANLKDLLAQLAEAKHDLDFAIHQFDEVADPAAVDEVIFRIKTAERKFDRLYEMAKSYNITEQDLKRIFPDAELFHKPPMP